MLRKVQTKEGIITCGVASIVCSIVFISLQDGLFYTDGGDLVYHISAIEIIGGIVLIVGAVKDKYKLYFPWLITTAVFIYGLIYAGIYTATSIYDFGENMICWSVLILFSAFLGLAMYAVYIVYEQKRLANQPAFNQSDAPPVYSPTSEKTWHINI
ncbi:uncharacterized protein LOC115634229 [Scaptodrosophila lebanonensis]|uniref:Uncharacterized protein LOC115634229 n=1 Tax=Drosophila lebanonensis TaxID=7225 RepID=A0A6J2UHR7_DROLE|nr:uncharacterized protein LOC115634229 [Scaptodrosophila lebanonensis]